MQTMDSNSVAINVYYYRVFKFLVQKIARHGVAKTVERGTNVTRRSEEFYSNHHRRLTVQKFKRNNKGRDCGLTQCSAWSFGSSTVLDTFPQRRRFRVTQVTCTSPCRALSRSGTTALDSTAEDVCAGSNHKVSGLGIVQGDKCIERILLIYQSYEALGKWSAAIQDRLNAK